MSFSSKFTKKDAMIAAGALVMGGAIMYLLQEHFSRGDSPILVRDGGSIILESNKDVALDDFIDVNDNLIFNPEGKWAMKMMTKTGTGSSVARCRGTSACRLEVTLNDLAGSKVSIGSGRRGKGLWIATTIGFTSWTRTDPKKWVLGDAALKVKDAKVYGTNQAEGTPLCAAAGCEITIAFSN